MLSTMTTNANASAMTDNLARAIPDAERQQLEDSARAALPEYLTAPLLEQMTGTPASTWRYWAHIGTGPASFKLGRRRVWKRSTVLGWLEAQEMNAASV
jgi:prophage regulatory protein